MKRKTLHRSSGAALIEAAIGLPVLLILVLGLLDSVLITTRISVFDEALQDSARVISLANFSGNPDKPNCDEMITRLVKKKEKNRGIEADRTKYKITVNRSTKNLAALDIEASVSIPCISCRLFSVSFLNSLDIERKIEISTESGVGMCLI